jgi:indolepyruvate ferredoxin oxidoreductase beta subunit
VIIPRRECVQTLKKKNKWRHPHEKGHHPRRIGGQGILTIAAILGTAAFSAVASQAGRSAWYDKGVEMSNHICGSRSTHLERFDPLWWSGYDPECGTMESLRYLPYLSKEGWIIANRTPSTTSPTIPYRRYLCVNHQTPQTCAH